MGDTSDGVDRWLRTQAVAVPVRGDQPIAAPGRRMDMRTAVMRPTVAADDGWPAAVYAGLGPGSLTTYHLMLAVTHAAYVSVSVIAAWHHLAAAWVAWRRA